ncbi:MAG: hypothetical protein R3B48_01205 [Kofleriaceae bacterium]
MRRTRFAATLSVACVVTAASVAVADPRAELVLLWAPGRAEALAPTARVARQAGAAVLDVTPQVAPVLAEALALRNGRAAYDALRFEEAFASLTTAVESIEATGAAGLTNTQLSDAFLYRGLAAVQLGRAESAWDDFVRAASVAPSRALDPAQFPPRAVEQFERARAYAAALPLVQVTLRRPPSCEVQIDARATSEATLALPRGRHWLVANCPGHQPAQRGFDATESLELAAAGPAIATLSDDAALVQARAIGARAVVVVTAAADLALVRRLGADGREQARRAVQLDADGPRALAVEVSALLRDEPVRTRWYRSRWTWAAAGALTATALLLPFVLRADEAPEVVLRPRGVPW